MNSSKSTAGGEIEHLTTAQCWRLLEESSLGRLAVADADGVPDVFPVNYTVHNGRVYLRSAPGSKLMNIAARPGIGFEVDGEDGVSQWSVVIKGTAKRLDTDAEIHESGIEELATATPTSRQDFVGIIPSSVTGRRFRMRGSSATRIRPPAPAHPSTGAPEPIRPPEDARHLPDSTPPDDDGPIPIPHYPPLT